MQGEQIDIVQESYKVVAFRAEDLAEQFFARVFQAQPTLRAMFSTDAWQRDRDFVSALGTLVRNLHRIDALSPIIEDVGVRCQRAGAQPHQFGVARDVLLTCLRDQLGPKWSAELDEAWTEALNVALSMLIRGGGRARLRAA